MNKFITLGMAALLAACQQSQKEQYSIDGMLTGDNIETGMAYLQKYQKILISLYLDDDYKQE